MKKEKSKAIGSGDEIVVRFEAGEHSKSFLVVVGRRREFEERLCPVESSVAGATMMHPNSVRFLYQSICSDNSRMNWALYSTLSIAEIQLHCKMSARRAGIQSVSTIDRSDLFSDAHEDLQ